MAFLTTGFSGGREETAESYSSHRHGVGTEREAEGGLRRVPKTHHLFIIYLSCSVVRMTWGLCHRRLMFINILTQVNGAGASS